MSILRLSYEMPRYGTTLNGTQGHYRDISLSTSVWRPCWFHL